MPVLFVYGTLKRGCGNHHVLRGARFLGEAIALDYTLPLPNVPCAVEAEGCRVRGELYYVDWELLRRLDRFEGHPEEYERRLAVLRYRGRKLRAWIYACRWMEPPTGGCGYEEYTC